MRRRSFVLSIPVARGANWFLAGGGRRMDEEEATAAAAERIAAAAEDGTSLPVRLATDVVRFLYGGTGRREPADGGVVSASLLNAKPAVGGIGVEPRGGGVLRVLFTVASDAVADTVVRWRHELRRCVDSTAVFDVLSFTALFKDEYGEAYVPWKNMGLSVKIDHLYIDVNSLLHTAMDNAWNVDGFHTELHARLDKVLTACEPRKSLMLAVDGPAPIAKLLSQRERRKKARGKKSTRETYYSLAVEVSDATVEGEGEMKMLGRLARPWQAGSEEDTHAIFGEDSDLVLMSLMSAVGPRLYVLRDASAHQRVSNFYVDELAFSVGKLHEVWTRTLLPEGRAVLGHSDEELLLGLGCDLVLLTVLSRGNDYLPRMVPQKQLTEDMWTAHARAWREWSPTASDDSGGPGIVRIGGRGSAPALSVRALHALLSAVGAAGAEGFRIERDADAYAAGEGKAPRDARGYLHGLVWLAHMCLTGECPDYRLGYDSLLPSPAQLLALCAQLSDGAHTHLVLHDFYDAPTDGSWLRPLLPPPEGGAARHHKPAARPLSPVTSALAMLPGSSSAHLLPPPASAWLLDAGSRPGSGGSSNGGPPSPARLYATCGECVTLEEARTATGKRVAEARSSLPKPAEDPAVAAAVAAGRAAIKALKCHTADAHPYERFPVQELSDAADALPYADFSSDARALTRLGCGVVIASCVWKPPDGVPCAKLVLGPDNGGSAWFGGALIVREPVLQVFTVAEPAAACVTIPPCFAGRVLLGENKDTIASVAATVPEFSTLVAAVSASPTILAAATDPSTKVTVLAPTNEAFTAALAALNMTAEDLLADTELLTKILSYHIVTTVFDSSAATTEGLTLDTLLPNATVFVQLVDGKVMINGVATVVAPFDVDVGGNSIVHAIDAVLLPPSKE
ncbi:hypothetical protein FOA52_002109 [Chlamydomonas sp. UWO 241]|nr:hypothetical protein FOA52_002109 [Chlamydomonas sp. UWO 241]